MCSKLVSCAVNGFTVSLTPVHISWSVPFLFNEFWPLNICADYVLIFYRLCNNIEYSDFMYSCSTWEAVEFVASLDSHSKDNQRLTCASVCVCPISQSCTKARTRTQRCVASSSLTRSCAGKKQTKINPDELKVAGHELSVRLSGTERDMLWSEEY